MTTPFIRQTLTIGSFLLSISLQISGQAQPVRFPKAAIQLQLPNSGWQLKDSSSYNNTISYTIERNTTDNVKPTIKLLVEPVTGPATLKDKLRISRMAMPYHEDQTFLPSDKDPKILYEKSIAYKATMEAGIFGPESTDYFMYLINDKAYVTMIYSASPALFNKYSPEFLAVMRSIKELHPVDAARAAAAGARKPAAAQPENLNDYCSYFPVKNGMKFMYVRSNMMGRQNIEETYTYINTRTLKGDKTIKGYKISSNDENRAGVIMYFYCDGGSTKFYSEMPAYDTHIAKYVEDYSFFPSEYNKPDHLKTPIWETDKYGSGIFLHFTELKAIPKDSSWTDVQMVNGNLVTISNTVIETGISMTLQGATYSPVIHIQRDVSVKWEGRRKNINMQDVYYAKGIGKIKMVEKGNDIFAGDYTTTQELVSYSIPK